MFGKVLASFSKPWKKRLDHPVLVGTMGGL